MNMTVLFPASFLSERNFVFKSLDAFYRPIQKIFYQKISYLKQG